MPDIEAVGKLEEHVHQAGQVSAPSIDGADLCQPGLMVAAGPFRDLAPLRRLPGADPLGGQAVSQHVVAELRRRRGRGAAVGSELSGPLERHFGMDLSAVRVHADVGAGQIARSLQAQAFTHGDDIYFGPGAYRPQSADGQRVLTHEMSHVIAQRTGADSSGHEALTVGRADDPAEAAADRSAERAMAALRRTPGDQPRPTEWTAGTVSPALRREPLAGADARLGSLAEGAKGEPVIRRYFDAWPVDKSQTQRKERFVAFLENAVTAGIPSEVAEKAGERVLRTWNGWSNDNFEDFDYAWINGGLGFKAVLADELDKLPGAVAEALAPLLEEVFSELPDPERLVKLGNAAGFTPGGQGPAPALELDPEWEKEIIDHFAQRFKDNDNWTVTRKDWKGQGQAFRDVWTHAKVPQKERMLVILVGPDWRTMQETGEYIESTHLSDLSYLVEGVTGNTPRNPEVDIPNWASNPRGNLFDQVDTLTRRKTKSMTEDERKDYRLEIRGDRIYRADGAPLVGDNIFVLSVGHVLYGGTKQSRKDQSESEDQFAVHHSSFMAGEPVKCAGHVFTNGSGKLTGVDDQSGHYTPNPYEFGSFLYGLKHHDGIDLDKIMSGNTTAGELLRQWEELNLPPEDPPDDGAQAHTDDDEDPFDENGILKNPFG